jgi:PIN domain nuclease of toxin-antitoxin system
MRLLLDTHVALWSVINDPRMPSSARDMIADRTNEIFVSVGSLWEIAIKYPLTRQGRGNMPVSAKQAREHFGQAGFRLLGITEEHTLAVEMLPLLHTDPFDRLIVAQALTEPARLLTHDAKVAAYSDTIIAV